MDNRIFRQARGRKVKHHAGVPGLPLLFLCSQRLKASLDQRLKRLTEDCAVLVVAREG